MIKLIGLIPDTKVALKAEGGIESREKNKECVAGMTEQFNEPYWRCTARRDKTIIHSREYKRKYY